jgi:hypothetical protein
LKGFGSVGSLGVWRSLGPPGFGLLGLSNCAPVQHASAKQAWTSKREPLRAAEWQQCSVCARDLEAARGIVHVTFMERT